jgi:hypothetical protein
MAEKNASKAPKPPAEAPIATIGKRSSGGGAGFGSDGILTGAAGVAVEIEGIFRFSIPLPSIERLPPQKLYVKYGSYTSEYLDLASANSKSRGDGIDYAPLSNAYLNSSLKSSIKIQI